MTIYLIRHGQTEFNAVGRYQGRLDSPLTEVGRLQAARMGVLLATLVAPGARLVSSPLGRAMATAAIIAEKASLPEAITDSRLLEISLGSWEGMTDEDIEFTFPGARDGTDRWNWHFASPDGEGYEDVAARAGAWLSEAIGSNTPLVAVSHGVTGRIIRGLHAGLPREEALKLDVPQDAVFRLDARGVNRIDCGPPGSATAGR
jgi:broad specificity phosphatase PhoE